MIVSNQFRDELLIR